MVYFFFNREKYISSNYHHIVNFLHKLPIVSISLLNYQIMSMSPSRSTKRQIIIIIIIIIIIRQKYLYKLKKKG